MDAFEAVRLVFEALRIAVDAARLALEVWRERKTPTDEGGR